MFLDFLTYGHMIDNVVLIVTGTLHERDMQVCERSLCMLFPLRFSSFSSRHLVVTRRRVCVCMCRHFERILLSLFSQELLDKCHPLGMFDSIATLAVASNMR
jgi:V-type H+-transporting ATPase subunit d